MEVPYAYRIHRALSNGVWRTRCWVRTSRVSDRWGTFHSQVLNSLYSDKGMELGVGFVLVVEIPRSIQ